MDDPLSMEIFQAVQDFPDDDGRLRFVECSGFDLGQVIIQSLSSARTAVGYQ